eukprot:GHVN01013970.1.p1 GENE.GHVN01013970.1~~GHVN01013970.1.p1  ORF type:complete len:562 (+),score=38.02 GHVN01013970.1:42-1688(+)
MNTKVMTMLYTTSILLGNIEAMVPAERGEEFSFQEKEIEEKIREIVGGSKQVIFDGKSILLSECAFELLSQETIKKLTLLENTRITQNKDFVESLSVFGVEKNILFLKMDWENIEIKKLSIKLSDKEESFVPEEAKKNKIHLDYVGELKLVDYACIFLQLIKGRCRTLIIECNGEALFKKVENWTNLDVTRDIMLINDACNVFPRIDTKLMEGKNLFLQYTEEALVEGFGAFIRVERIEDVFFVDHACKLVSRTDRMLLEAKRLFLKCNTEDTVPELKEPIEGKEDFFLVDYACRLIKSVSMESMKEKSLGLEITKEEIVSKFEDVIEVNGIFEGRTTLHLFSYAANLLMQITMKNLEGLVIKCPVEGMAKNICHLIHIRGAKDVLLVDHACGLASLISVESTEGRTLGMCCSEEESIPRFEGLINVKGAFVLRLLEYACMLVKKIDMNGIDGRTIILSSEKEMENELFEERITFEKIREVWFVDYACLLYPKINIESLEGKTVAICCEKKSFVPELVKVDGFMKELRGRVFVVFGGRYVGSVRKVLG